MIYLTLGYFIVCSPEQGHPQRVHVHLWWFLKRKTKQKKQRIIQFNLSTNIFQSKAAASK